jgi:hypothetical protein
MLGLGEFKTLCFFFDVDLDEIIGDCKSSKVYRLILRSSLDDTSSPLKIFG